MAEIADDKIEKIGKINQIYLTDYFTFLSYMIEKGEAERAEDEFNETLRRAKSKSRR